MRLTIHLLELFHVTAHIIRGYRVNSLQPLFLTARRLQFGAHLGHRFFQLIWICLPGWPAYNQTLKVRRDVLRNDVEVDVLDELVGEESVILRRCRVSWHPLADSVQDTWRMLKSTAPVAMAIFFATGMASARYSSGS